LDPSNNPVLGGQWSDERRYCSSAWWLEAFWLAQDRR